MVKKLMMVTLIYSSTLMARTCELDTSNIEKNEYTIYNPFTACIDDLKIPGLPENRQQAWKMMVTKGGVLGQVTKVVCESIYDAVKDEFKDAFKDVIKGAIGKGNKVDVKDVVKYCQKHPEICLAGSKSVGEPPNSQTGVNAGAKPAINPVSNSAPSWGGWGGGQKKPAINQAQSDSGSKCHKKPWLCSSDAPKSKQNQTNTRYEEKFEPTKKRY